MEHIDHLCDLFVQYRNLFQNHNLVLVIYEPRSKTNEQDSAALFEEFARDAHLAAADAATVRDWILATASHMEAAAGEGDLAGFLDLDLAVLALPEARYDRYRRHIRAEYAHVPDAAFRTGRAAVLRKFLQAPQLYRRSALRDALEPTARMNIQRELEALSNPTQPLLV